MTSRMVEVGAGTDRGVVDDGADPRAGQVVDDRSRAASADCVPAQTGGATNTPRSGSLKDCLATNSFIGFAVPHWSVTSGSEKS